MTKLRLTDFPVQTTNPENTKEVSWELSLKTTSREELIYLSIFIASALNSEFFTDKTDIPLFLISGSSGAGKSMVVEAMMKTILDQTNPLDMLSLDAKKTMFIEKRPTQATREYCYAAGTVLGEPAVLGFDRVSSRNVRQSELVQTFRQASTGFIQDAPGAIFQVQKNRDDGSWLQFNMDGEDDWNRDLRLSVYSEKLKNDLLFFSRWKLLQRAIANNDHSIFAPGAWQGALVFGENYIKGNYVDRKAELLKMAYEDSSDLGFRQKDILKIAAAFQIMEITTGQEHFWNG